MFKKEKGITLVALVVTIIVLLILAAVSINIALNGGIINRAKNATSQYSGAAANETNSLKYVQEDMDNYINSIGK